MHFLNLFDHFSSLGHIHQQLVSGLGLVGYSQQARPSPQLNPWFQPIFLMIFNIWARSNTYAHDMLPTYIYILESTGRALRGLDSFPYFEFNIKPASLDPSRLHLHNEPKIPSISESCLETFWIPRRSPCAPHGITKLKKISTDTLSIEPEKT